MIKREALFSDETEQFKTPYQPRARQTVTVKLRTLAQNVTRAYCVLDGAKREMKKINGDATFDFYALRFVCPNRPTHYYFVVYDEEDRVYYNKLGCVENHQSAYDFVIYPGFTVPEWSRGAVFYQIFTDRFCNGEKSNDVENNEYYYTGGHAVKVTDWNKYPDELDVRCFYGGDLQGVRQKLDYLQDLGVEAIYFNPLFLSPSNHKYDTQDYDYIDPHLAIVAEDEEHALQGWEKHNGFARRYIKRVTSKKNLQASNAYFAGLVKEIHARGMRVVIDGVFNHCGSFNKWLDKEGVYLNKKGYIKGAYQSTHSKYRSFFSFYQPEVADSGYEGWWGYESLPKLNYEKSPKLEQTIMQVGEKWVSAPYNVDGWRLDVAADLGHSAGYNHQFWQKFRKHVRGANKDALIFAEHYGDATPWFNGKEWDTVMNYDAFMEPVTWFLTGMEKHSDAFDGNRLNDGKAFFDSMFKNMSKFPRPSLDAALNQLSNHDHSRFLTRTNGMVGRVNTRGSLAAGFNVDLRVFALGVMIQMTWPGAPGIYYGDEAGQVGWTDPDNRRTYPWGKENTQLIDYHKKIIGLRKTVNCLKSGSLKALDAGHGYVAYGRFDAADCAVVVINNGDEPLTLSVPVWELGVKQGEFMHLAFDTKRDGFLCADQTCEVKYGRMKVELPAKSGKIYTVKFS